MSELRHGYPEHLPDEHVYFVNGQKCYYEPSSGELCYVDSGGYVKDNRTLYNGRTFVRTDEGLEIPYRSEGK
jgi:hypothetical protein